MTKVGCFVAQRALNGPATRMPLTNGVRRVPKYGA
jgi:hypothetical protein